MRYLLLIHVDENMLAQWSPQEFDEKYAECLAMVEEMKRAGVFITCERLRRTPLATTVRVRNGQTLTTDGPFAETKEQLAGFYLIRADNRDEALAWAARTPQAQFGSVEVRPVWE
jgi:hypothetical protein